MMLSAISSQRLVNAERWLLEGWKAEKISTVEEISVMRIEEVFAQLIDEYDQRRITAEVG